MKNTPSSGSFSHESSVFDPETLAFYEEHAADFIERTLSADLSSLYRQFLPHVPKGGHILDVGCGSGRDAKAFLDRGYEVTAIDAVDIFVAHTKKLLGSSVVLKKQLDAIEWNSSFDAIWACASLLHTPAEQLPSVLKRLVNALVPGGILYVSFKLGEGEHRRNGRLFVDQTPKSLGALLKDIERTKLLDIWETDDVRKGRISWVNGLVKREESA